MTAEEKQLWRLKPCVKLVDLICNDGSLMPTEVNRARFTVLGETSITGETLPLCEFYSNALDGGQFILPYKFIEKWDDLVERA